jgi:hypothetical protein
MNKQQIGDCCGSRVIYNFSQAQSRYNFRTGSTTYEEPTPAVLARLIRYDAPGFTMATLTRTQNNKWSKELLSRGFVLVTNNVRNSNTNNRLFVYMRIDRPHVREPGVRFSRRMADVFPMIVED